MPTATYHTYSPHRPEQLLSVLTDFGGYPAFLPHVEDTSVRLQGPPTWEVRFVLNLIRRIEYEIRLELKREELEIEEQSSMVSKEKFLLSWSLLEGVFKSNSGFWCLQELSMNEAIEQGLSSGTEINYSISMQLDTYLPRSIYRSLTNQAMPTIVQHVLEETERRYPLSGS